ncbi:MAG TPA: flagellar hook-length control protein FliK [Candidatus Desulfobacillus sp.]|nr:flagellar hook-length control protein FliK [Candidatus Desulfobacillus sp.]
MIPSDLAARLRLLTESIVNPVAATHEIAGELPELAGLDVGQRFIARIESALPDGSFRALVAGRSLNLSLPQAAEPGETLELVVTARTPRLVVAASAAQEAARQAAPSLSQAARLIGALLAGVSEPAQPAALSRAAPLLPSPSPQAMLLAPALRQAIGESGLFYEAHQAQWLAGRYPEAALAREPQARFAREAQAAPDHSPRAGVEAKPMAMPQAMERAAGEAVLRADAGEAASKAEAAAPARPAAAAEMPAQLQSLVQQQLNAAATSHIVWRGELWPGQALDWEIAADADARGATEDEAATAWTTRLRLNLPNLGRLDLALGLAGNGASLVISADADRLTSLQDGLAELAAAFSAAGLPPLTARMEAHEPG